MISIIIGAVAIVIAMYIVALVVTATLMLMMLLINGVAMVISNFFAAVPARPGDTIWTREWPIWAEVSASVVIWAWLLAMPFIYG